jgi:uridine phosphorylase
MATNNLVPGGGEREYHLDVLHGDIAERCIVTGDPARAEAIARHLLSNPRMVGDHRGLRSFTGDRHGIPVSVVTHGMGGPSIGIVLPEAVRCGARAFIRVGSCGALQPGIAPGDVIVYTGSMRYDGASLDWAPPEFPAIADHHVVRRLIQAADRAQGVRRHVGIGATMSDFNEGQARSRVPGDVPSWVRERHEWILANGILSYSMEEATLFVWCATHGRIPCGAVNAVFVNRVEDGEPAVLGELDAAAIAVDAICKLDLPPRS